MDEQVAKLLHRLGDTECCALWPLDQAMIAHLPARLAIKWGLIDDYGRRVASSKGLDLLAIFDQRGNLPLGRLSFIAEELGRARALLDVEPDRFSCSLTGAFPGFACFSLLLFHGGGKASGVDPNIAGAQRILRQIEGKSEGVVKLEGDISWQRGASRELGRCIRQQPKAALQRFTEAAFFELERFGDQWLGPHQLLVGLAHLPDQRRHEAMHQRIGSTEQMRVPHRPPHDPAQNIAAPFVRRQYAIGNQETRCPQMIGDDPVARLVLALSLDTCRFDRCCDQRLEQIDLVVVVRALEHGGNPLEPHAGVDRRFRQIDPITWTAAFILHENEVPDLNEPVAVSVR